MTESVPVHFSITEAFIAEHDAYDILEPVGWTISAHKDRPSFERSLRIISEQQSECLALLWYRNEVDNGGHAQFLAKVACDLWNHAILGFHRLELPDLGDNLERAIHRLHLGPFRERNMTDARLAELPEGAFAIFDEVFYAFERVPPELDEVVLQFIRAHPERFLFEGVVMKEGH